MAIGLMNRIWWREDLDASEKLVLLSLADRADDEGVCWYAVATIARKASMSDRGVQKVIGRLCGRGLLRKVHRQDRSNFYIIPVDKFPEQEIVKPSKETSALEYIEEQDDLFGGRGERGSPARGERRSSRGERGSERGEPGSPDSLSDSLIDTNGGDNAREETIPEMVVRRWNELAAEHPALAPFRGQLSAERISKIDARTNEGLKSPPVQAILNSMLTDPKNAVWLHVFATIAGSKLLTGNKTSWAPTFDWMLGPKNFTKIMEGQYGHGHDRIDAIANDASGRSAVEAGRAAAKIVEGHKLRLASRRAAGHSGRAAGAHR